MTEYLMIFPVTAKPRHYCATVSGPRGGDGFLQFSNESGPEGFVIHSPLGETWAEKQAFEDNAVEIAPGTGQALKAVAATALLGAMHGLPLPGLPQDAANDEESAAERGEFNDAMITAVARIAFNVVREWKKYEGLLHHPPFDEASELQQNMARTRVRNIAQNVRYPLDIANKANVFEDQMYRIVCAAVLAD